MIGPGFVDLDALADLDTTILGFDNQPAWKKGRVWPRSYLDAGPVEMYTAEELAFQKRHAFSLLIRNGITTAMPIASLFYRAWGETPDEFAAAAGSAAELGLRVYLGPAYRTGNMVVESDGRIENLENQQSPDESNRNCRNYTDTLIDQLLNVTCDQSRHFLLSGDDRIGENSGQDGT